MSSFRVKAFYYLFLFSFVSCSIGTYQNIFVPAAMTPLGLINRSRGRGCTAGGCRGRHFCPRPGRTQ